MSVGGRVELPSKSPGSTRVYLFDFTSYLAAGETIASASFSISPWWGVDPSPNTLLSGSPAIAGGSAVTQRITGGLLGVIYEITCTAQTVLSSANYQLLQLKGFLAVVPEA